MSPPGAGLAPSSPIRVLPDSAVVLEEGNSSETSLPVEHTELEDFEATLGTDRRCGRAEAYSRVSAWGSLGRGGAVGLLTPSVASGLAMHSGKAFLFFSHLKNGYVSFQVCPAQIVWAFPAGPVGG